MNSSTIDEICVNNIDMYDKNKCWARLLSNPEKQCRCKPKPNSNFCGKHLKKGEEGSIDTIFDLVKKPVRKKLVIKEKKFKRRDILVDLSKITKCQSYIRKFLVTNNIKKRGIAAYCKHLINNETDCLTFNKIIDIPLQDLFTYRDNNIYWGFNIKTFKEILKLNIPNPYSTLPIPNNIKEKFGNLIKTIEQDRKIEIEKPKIKDKYLLLQQKCIDIFRKWIILKITQNANGF